MKTIVVIGGGHAGCEAALAAARIGAKVILFALSLDSIAHLPCNPCIGGSAKGHLVREIDALGGEMARAIDATFIQSRMLNTAKGPAVYSLRAQTDKKNYMTYMKKILENEKNIFLREGEIVEILTTEVLGGFTPGSVLPSASLLSEPLQTFYKKFDKNFNTETRSRVSDESFEGVRGNFSKSFPEKKNKNSPEKKIVSVKTANNEIIPCDAAIVCTGTYLNARCLHGETIAHTGPGGLKNARGLSDCLEKLGFALQRFKTGTPARIHKRSVDFSKMSAQHGDEKIVPFSFETDPREIFREQIPCHLTYTTPATHEIIRASLHRSAMYSGLIEATGTRYCPSIEDKIVRFSEKERHPVFIEPEGINTHEMYVQGMSSALPEDVQREVYRSVPGLENCEIMRVAYAIEYDCIDATQLTTGLESKHIGGLFFAGQICGSSGYEEAAAQGLIAGISSCSQIEIGRADGYIGVLIDDLVTKGTREPYRMMTSRAEYRLLLRQDNADLRLTPKGFAAGLISRARWEKFLQKSAAIEAEISYLKKTILSPETANPILLEKNSAPIKSGTSIADLIKRPELNLFDFDTLREKIFSHDDFFSHTAREQANIQLKYEGYIAIQQAQAESFRKTENKLLPPDIDYEKISGLRIEARQKLSALRPKNFGQASRVTGISPADLSVLMVYCKTL